MKREDLFVTSKVWNDAHAPEEVEKRCRESLTSLQLDYLDLYLIHWPATTEPGDVLTPSIQETWTAMEGLVAKGECVYDVHCCIYKPASIDFYPDIV